MSISDELRRIRRFKLESWVGIKNTEFGEKGLKNIRDMMHKIVEDETIWGIFGFCCNFFNCWKSSIISLKWSDLIVGPGKISEWRTFDCESVVERGLWGVEWSGGEVNNAVKVLVWTKTSFRMTCWSVWIAARVDKVDSMVEGAVKRLLYSDSSLDNLDLRSVFFSWGQH